MAPKEVQISAYVSDETKQMVDRYAEAHGIRKGHLIEAALRHHLQALEQLPADIIVPSRLVVTNASAEQIAARLAKPPAPTKAMRELFQADGPD